MSRLRAARDDQRRMVASVSHDLKTPLTVIRGYAQALCEGLVPPDRVDAYHRVIHERALAAADLLEEFSAYARMEHPEHALELVRADVRDLVAASVDEARPLAEQRGCRRAQPLRHARARELHRRGRPRARGGRRLRRRHPFRPGAPRL